VNVQLPDTIDTATRSESDGRDTLHLPLETAPSVGEFTDTPEERRVSDRPAEKEASGHLLTRVGLFSAAALVLLTGVFLFVWLNGKQAGKAALPEVSSQTKGSDGVFYPTDSQWATLTTEPVRPLVFRSEHVTEGKIAVDEEKSTLVFSPYAGRVTKLLAKPGETVARGQPLFVVEATDMVQAQNDFISAATGMNKARSQLNLAQIQEKRAKDLSDAKAVPLKEWQQAQAALVTAQNDLRSAEITLEAARNRLRILGRTENEISTFQEKGTISAETPIYSPLAGTVVQRKIGPGQYIASGASDPVFIIGDLSTVWLLAYVRETEAPKVHPGQAISFTVLAFPERAFHANVSYVAAALDSTSRRLLVRASVNNSEGLLKPEMFAMVTILTGEGDAYLAVPRNAIIYEGSSARVWVARDDNGVELRNIQPGIATDNMVQVIKGLQLGEKVITKGSLFIDRAAVSGAS
jgi:cobalt-zinc-cadmium efflux system membrane fusion protein